MGAACLLYDVLGDGVSNAAHKGVSRSKDDDSDEDDDDDDEDDDDDSDENDARVIKDLVKGQVPGNQRD